MVADSKQYLRNGTTNLTSTETNPAADSAHGGPLTVIGGLPRAGRVRLKAFFKSAFVGTSAVHTLTAGTLPTGGTITITLGNQTTAALTVAAGLTAAAIQTALSALQNVVINGIMYNVGGTAATGGYNTLTAGTDIVVTGGAYFTGGGTVTITFGGKLANQPVPGSANLAAATGGATLAYNTGGASSSVVGSSIAIQVTDGTAVLDGCGSIILAGHVPPFKEVAILIDASQARLTAGVPLSALNYIATPTGTNTVSTVCIFVDDTSGTMN